MKSRKAPKKVKNNYSKVESILAITGSLLVLLTFIATVFSVAQNERFINPTNFGDYARYVIVICGGFAVGSIASTFNSKRSALFNGTVYGLFGLLLFTTFDTLRGSVEPLGYPMSAVVYFGMPYFVLLLTAGLSAVLHLSSFGRNKADVLLPVIYVANYVFAQLVWIGYVLILLLKSPEGGTWISPEVALLGLLFNPLFIAVAAYVFLSDVKSQLLRAFYASVIGVLPVAFAPILWEFNGSADTAVLQAYSVVVPLVSVVVAVVLVWLTRDAAQKA